MVLYHQTFSPSACGCVIEQQFEHDEVTGLNDNPQLWFFHFVCAAHEPLVKNKPKPANIEQQRKKIIDHHTKLLQDNRQRHLKDFDEHPSRKQKRDAINEMKKLFDTEKHALRMEAAMDQERDTTVVFLDKHQDESMDYLLTGLHSPYALVAQEVYDKIMQEQSTNAVG